MAQLSVSERVRIARLSADSSRRAVVSRALGSPLLRWRYGAMSPGQLLIVPQDLRTADPSLWREIELGHFGLAGAVARTHGQSPFDVTAPSEAWARALHSFGWLRHLAAVDTEEARETARRFACDWVARAAPRLAWEPAVASRRLISWLSHAGLLLEGAEARSYDALMDSLGLHLRRLAGAWRDAPAGQPRLLALTALVLADLCLAGHDRQLAALERTFGAEISRQFLPDGGHVSRNAAVLVELALDLLPLSQCFAARGRPVPEALVGALRRALPFLRTVRLGDGRLARFNGTGVASPAGLATVLAYDDTPGVLRQDAPVSRYARLERGRTVVLVDVGAPPPLELAGEAHAGCLSFEMSAGARLLLVNGGAPSAADGEWRPASRATANHNTLALAEQSSSRLVRNRRLERLVGALPIRGPETVRAVRHETAGALELEASHDGYLARFGMLHHRRLRLDAGGRSLSGVDRLGPPGGRLRLKHDVPFAIHFHVHPEAACRGHGAGAAEIALGDGSLWRFAAEGAVLSIEESIHFADSSGPRRALQIVLRGATVGESEIRWRLAAHP